MAFLNKPFASDTNNIIKPTEEEFNKGIVYESDIISPTINGYLNKVTDAVIDLQNQPSEITWNTFTSKDGVVNTPYNYGYGIVPFATSGVFQGMYIYNFEETRFAVPAETGIDGTALFLTMKGTFNVLATNADPFVISLPVVIYDGTGIPVAYKLSPLNYCIATENGKPALSVRMTTSSLLISSPTSVAGSLISFSAHLVVDTSGRPPAPTGLTAILGANELITLDWTV